MSAAPRPAQRVVGVKRLADYLKRKVDADPHLREVAVLGEISNYGAQKNGRLNFDLKEGEYVLRCFAWESDAAAFPALQNGLAIVATGAVTAYAARSTYQLVVRSVALEGEGRLHALFEETKKRLQAEGLFAAERKRPLPQYPFRVALVSSRTANGAIDFVTLLRDRAPHVGIVWCETAVQGPNAAVEIVSAIGRASRADVDLIVVTRGGGSFEDLFAFSDERVVRAVARARHPVISAIGHTADRQLCDFAADRHVETPSAAAEAVGFARHELLLRIGDAQERARRSAALRVERLSNRLAAALTRSKLAQPQAFLVPLARRLSDAGETLDAAASGRAAPSRGARAGARTAARRARPVAPPRGTCATVTAAVMRLGRRGLAPGRTRGPRPHGTRRSSRRRRSASRASGAAGARRGAPRRQKSRSDPATRLCDRDVRRRHLRDRRRYRRRAIDGAARSRNALGARRTGRITDGNHASGEFEEALKRLEEIVQRLERENVGLDESVCSSKKARPWPQRARNCSRTRKPRSIDGAR